MCGEMITIQEVYETYRRVQGRCLGRPYRLPKDFNSWYINAPSATQTNLDTITKFFNTKWQNIDPDEYFSAGFAIFKTFSYHQFLNPKVMNFYIDRDKMKKRTLMGCKSDIIKFNKFIQVEHKCVTYQDYCAMKSGELSQPIADFLSNKIGKYALTHLIYRKFLILQDHERGLISIITSNYRDLVAELEEYYETCLD